MSNSALQTLDEYLTIEELSARLKIKPKTVKNKMASGIFQKGIHYFSPKGLRPRFKWSAIVASGWARFRRSTIGPIRSRFGPARRRASLT